MTGRQTIRLVREWAPLVLGVLVVAAFIRLLLLQSYQIPTESMLPTLEVGDRVIVNRVSYGVGQVERGQVVVFERPPDVEGDDDFIKRVVGLPGETIRLIDQQVFVGELQVVEPYLLTMDSTRTAGPIPGCSQPTEVSNRCVVPEGHIFVMGDNRENSLDSREFGPVPIDTIVGRAFWKVWPPNDLSQL